MPPGYWCATRGISGGSTRSHGGGVSGAIGAVGEEGLIEGVSSSDVRGVLPSEALLMERWVPIDDSETGWQHVHINMA